MLFNRLATHIADNPADKLYPMDKPKNDVNPAEGGDKGFDADTVDKGFNGDVVSYLEAQFRSLTVRQLKVALLERGRTGRGT